MKSTSEGELGVDAETAAASSRLKRTLTLTRNSIENIKRMSRRRIRLKNHHQNQHFHHSNVEHHHQQNHQLHVDDQIGLQTNVEEMNNNNNNNNANIHNNSNGNNKKLFRKPSIHYIFSQLFRVNWKSNGTDKSILKMKDNISLDDPRVPPTRPPHIPADRVPGVIGLRNHGNTCFINAVLQCLSHTDILAEYFVLDLYKDDLQRRNKLNSKKYGTKGEITEQLALLLKAIWSCQYDPEMSTAFKSVVDKYASQYRGNLQHDAQEFLLWLLDKVHEDLNRAGKKKYKIVKNSFGKPDDVATETLVNHMRCNDSFVYAIFQAQFRSSLTCPRCNRQSNTFDPFLCVSVPVPQTHRQINLFVNVLYTSQQPRQVKIGVSVSQALNVKELREILASDTGIEEAHLLLTEVHDEGFHRTFSDCQPLTVITENDPLYCIELPQLKEPAEQAYILLVWINVLVKGNTKERFGSPYTMQVSRETSYEDLQKLLLKEMHATLAEDVLTSSQSPGLFNIRVADPAATPVQDEHPCIDPCVEHPLYTEQIEQALSLCADDSGPPHVKLILEWDDSSKNQIIQDDSDQVEEHASVQQLKSNNELGSVNLEECFDLYTRAEVLDAEDAWHCPHCNRKQEVVKKLGLWSLPDILVIHLKRFRQQSKQRSTTKLTVLVDFPLYGFDMTPHLANGGAGGGGVSMLGGLGLGWSPWKKPRNKDKPPSPLPKFDENVYDLYAICNHHGQDLQSGHYTAFCKNPYDAQWYCFDDTRVEPVADTNLVTNAAYMLFYQRRGIANSTNSTSSAASTSSAGSNFEHWVSRMRPFYYRRGTEGEEVKVEGDQVVQREQVIEGEQGVEEDTTRREWSLPIPNRKASPTNLAPTNIFLDPTTTIDQLDPTTTIDHLDPTTENNSILETLIHESTL